jgi:aminoacrylate hydrolase
MPILTRSDVRIAYDVTGNGPPVLLVQGAGVCGEGWRPQVDALAGRFTLITFDNRGFGRSSMPAGRLTIEDMAEDALALADAVGAARFHLAGHSMGGLIAQEVALRAPERVLTLSFLCTFARGPQASRITPALLLTSLRMRIGPRAARRRAFLSLVMPSSYLQQVDQTALAARLQSLYGYDLANQPSFVMQQVRAMARFDRAGQLSRLRDIPTLVVSATHDRIAHPAYGRELASLIPGARYVEIADAGHAVTIQRADVVNELLARHLEGARDEATGAARGTVT